MLNIKIKSGINLLIRFIVSWLISTLVFTIGTLLKSKINYGFKDQFLTVGYGFLIICAIYFIGISIFRYGLENLKNRVIYSIIISFFASLGFMMLWGNPFKSLNFLEILIAIIFMCSIGLCISLIDYWTQKLIGK